MQIFKTTMSLLLNGELIETKLVREREYRHIVEAIAYEKAYLERSTGYESCKITKDEYLGVKFKVSHLNTNIGLAETIVELKRMN